ncbi:MAG: aminoacyl-tRNA hydrolase [candidate division NC10 bacterium]|nr:aminoacyl-tRNA hydrolase [candidate division NC10 bacterium]
MEPTRGAAWLVAGLGNPGPGYRETRHNIGFGVADRLAADGGARFRPLRHGVQGVRLDLGGTLVVVVKPQTFMNACGPAVAAWLTGLELPADRLVVLHDDLDLALGRLRVVAGGGAGGHRGVISIQSALGLEAVSRVRIGIGRPPAGVEAADFVLQAFRPEEQPEIAAAMARAAEAVRQIVIGGLVPAMNRYNAPLRPGGEAADAGESARQNRVGEGG